MLICPKCGTIGFSTGIICCKTKELICIDCCMMCDHYYKNISGGHGCRYVAANWHDEKTPQQLRLNQIRNEIKDKEREQDYVLSRGYKSDRYRANKLAAEIIRLKREEQRLKAETA